VTKRDFYVAFFNEVLYSSSNTRTFEFPWKTNGELEGLFLEKTPKYFIVEAAALPEIFLKVAEAKRMLETGETDKVNEATKAVGISRSAFYKYRDSIAPFQNLMAGRIINFQLMLKNKAGVLSALISIFAGCGANILTINQAIPTGGRAVVTVSAETGELECSLEELLNRIEATPGVVRAEMVAG